MKALNPNDFAQIIEQPASFGIGRPIKIGVGADGLFSVFDEHDAWLFGPTAFGEVPDGHPSIKPEYMRISLAMKVAGGNAFEIKPGQQLFDGFGFAQVWRQNCRRKPDFFVSVW